MNRRKVFFAIKTVSMYESPNIALARLLLVVPLVFAGLWLADIELNISALMGKTMIESRR